jgi:hypothetical protein
MTASGNPGTGSSPSGSKSALMMTLFIVLCVCILSVFVVRWFGSGSDPDKRADELFRAQMSRTLGMAGWTASIAATNGACVITFVNPVPTGIAGSVANMSAAVYAQIRRQAGTEPKSAVEVQHAGRTLATAESDGADVDWRAELQKMMDVAREAERKALGGR